MCLVFDGKEYVHWMRAGLSCRSWVVYWFSMFHLSVIYKFRLLAWPSATPYVIRVLPEVM